MGALSGAFFDVVVADVVVDIVIVVVDDDVVIVVVDDVVIVVVDDVVIVVVDDVVIVVDVLLYNRIFRRCMFLYDGKFLREGMVMEAFLNICYIELTLYNVF